MRFAMLTAVFGLLLVLAAPGVAQTNLFAAAVTVNDRAVTNWEVQQRQRFLTLLNAPPEVVAGAQDTLVNERLQLDAADRLGLTPTPEDVQNGMREFAARANLSAEQFITQLQGAGVAGETFRDFVAAGVTWRNVLRSQFGARAQVTEEEIDRAMALATAEGGARILMAELVVPLTDANATQARALLTRLSDELDGDISGFTAAARRYSAAGSRQAGGQLGWRPLAALPAALQSVLVSLPEGGVTDPVPLGNALALFQLRGFEEGGLVAPELRAVDYAIVPVRDAADAANLRDALDTCDDLYGVRPDAFTRTAQQAAEIPANVAAELARLDDNEVSITQTADGGTLFVMLCGRSTELPEGAREQIREALRNQRLETYADGYLEQLRAEAIIRVAE